MQPAILLLGPTGAGKTPLGEVIERRGIWGSRCAHFDFGAEMRRIAAQPEPSGGLATPQSSAPAGLDQEEADFIRGVLCSGALLEDRDFPIAEKILRAFLARAKVDVETMVVLNGLPRHAGQAQAVASIVDVRDVIVLECTPEVVRARIRRDAGGDRAGRLDDGEAEVRRKLETYCARTAPLVEHYRGLGVPVYSVEVGEATRAEEIRERLRRLA